ncbi:DUF5333 family protein [Primorskyibacter sp. S187A]|uniref:DUF5333 family protein n=1 Tax=Primorskyibacter sp. S187A TaxID=3415130 RepID=UPI003C7C5519
MLKQTSLAVAIFAFLAGCQTTTTGPSGNSINAPRPQAQEIPEDFYQLAFNAGVASTLGQRCRSVFYSKTTADRAERDAVQDLMSRGYIANDIKAWTRNLPKARMQADLINYLETNNVVIGDRDSVCAAARREIAAGSAVGRFLRERG